MKNEKIELIHSSQNVFRDFGRATARIAELVRSPKAMQAMMKMVKFDIAELERAAQDG